MRVPLYQVDAFAERAFTGNPAAVCVLDDWLPDDLLQSIAAENNLSETAFVVPREGPWGLRWFTPRAEVDLCGHATLASALVVFERLQPDARSIRFETRSGEVSVDREGELLVLDFPTIAAHPCTDTPDLYACLGRAPVEVLVTHNTYVGVFATEADVRAIEPDPVGLLALDRNRVLATAPGDECDIVSRFFAPQLGVPEDPVTGSAHAVLAPLWAARLGRNRLTARQLSERGGTLELELRGDRVRIGGRAVLYLEGVAEIPVCE